ncbi:septation protein SepH [Corynebacterium sp.]|uniref:septation protein SepH n=1 Tax=Corynebacterium sp. TaxID=1720 RepID=UPI003B3A264C
MAENTQWMEVPPMQELRFVRDDSDRASLVLRIATDGADGADGADGSGEFFLPVTDELTGFLGIAAASPETPDPSNPSDLAEPAETDAAGETTPAPSTPEPVAVATRERIHLRPKEIQDRIRHGETVEQIVAETGMEDRRVRPFAVPIAMERNRIADMARDAHPVRADGPTEAPLREVLAGAFSARGENFRAADWSAAMDSSDHWIISVSWTKGNREGASRFVADFRYVPGEDGPSTVEPVNSVASDLIDPRFERPVRTVSPVIPSSRQDDVEDEEQDGYRGHDGGTEARTTGSRSGGVPPRGGDETRPDNVPVDASPASTAGSAADSDADAPVDLFGRRTHPAGGDDDPARRRKKAVTPHWEDVLLGVRTNPKSTGRNKKK